MSPPEPPVPVPVVIRYRNWLGRVKDRRILPVRIWFGSTAWHHHGDQWLLDARDLDKGVDRTFAMRDILAWGLQDRDKH